jgi:2-polyprenyl-3-methyl-5-hydroxy-6-metoxy-1,4-benzoquinol methylase
MPTEIIHALDKDILEFFARKGKESQPGESSAKNANGLKVRRIMQIVRDLANKPMEELSVLDLACGEGVYAIETALRGSKVCALDARNQRMEQGENISGRLGLSSLSFVQKDIREVTLKSQGEYDVIYLLGILYHLDVPDSINVIKNLYAMCRHLLIIDTHISLNPQEEIRSETGTYKGSEVREHSDDDSKATRRNKLLASIDNTFSFLFTKESLVSLLRDVGFTTVFECHAPLEPFKPRNRITMIACKGFPVRISTYPWVNGINEKEIESLMANEERLKIKEKLRNSKGVTQYATNAVNGILRLLGYEIRRVA